MDIAIKLIVFLPLVAAAIAGLFCRVIGARPAQVITCAALLIAAALSIFVFVKIGFGTEKLIVVKLFSWMESGTLDIAWALRVDTLTAVMLIVVTVVSSMVHVYSIGYMADDPSIPRFMSYLSLFTFFMLMLVTSDNLVQLFFGWEGVGLASYLLIGFWYDKPSANNAAMKAFIVNRVGDFGFALGIAAVWMLSGSVGFEEIFAKAPQMAQMRIQFLGMDLPALETACLLLFIGAMGKSAQLGLHTWLPDAMEGPTPVSALIHAATMVTAGVFMVCRLSPLFELAPTVSMIVTIVGAATAFFAATVGMTQFDIKRVVAYSTCSQLGYMFFACGVGGYSAAMFHLTTHAFFKALLFLGSGSVINCLHHEQDMRKMGGVKEKAPQTFLLMWVGTLALSGIGIPFIFGTGLGFAGFYSKDIMLESAFGVHTTVGVIAYWLGVIAALMTAFYSTRLMFMTFYGKYRGDHHTWDHAHESPVVMLIPLYVLGIGAAFSGLVGYDWFVGHDWRAFWGNSVAVKATEEVLHHAHEVPVWVKLAPLVFALVGIAIAYYFYIVRTDMPARTVKRFPGLHALFYNKWYFDELYDAVFVKPSLAIGRFLWKKGDGATIDGLGPDNVAARAQDMAGILMRFQSGYLYHYAFVMLVGVAGLVTYFMLSAR
ncbi:NADH-quinone oxidoreductase subunit L [Reyranella sp.]|jgi:NADH-quinone oxidoreductase subunit L|uniref:NADH-quinone oxidoreductase subunit L n=1 Tax=Reyranella sp. TaxID=1929291 RepID=UPI000BC9DD69|nr:NADH-quinone oxidoreductase subunit L [Reyranella sp.]OYY45926.1 MAG: NADH-quinone oxidoreductase subunit L [Rhodospirillales bacterium 35-66-84]OYZ96307.1 MAG: NADH-quinone oxidoreductase subunit L [Rhodospirillales bacterium 24-66-33]OZB28531.1 MAG: NADH-quinone oxidoreductase subunit L [Rhodospirillales bacterium 39-66-50]HQS14257.1 NADH-quinone oxidoreductase subunit L [Reyranella sp.]HQT11253.1 NADH-quinone oxidoreductase subunit L [Reyranella sp.]